MGCFDQTFALRVFADGFENLPNLFFHGGSAASRNNELG
jgi:hypothetical protein